MRSLIATLSGSAGYLTAGMLLACYAAVAFYPFEWDPPWRVENGAERTDGGGLRFLTPGLARTEEPPDWLPRAIARNQLRLSMRARSHRDDQTGPAYLFSCAEDYQHANIIIAQFHRDLVVQFRWEGSNTLGEPPLIAPRILSDGRWREIELSMEPGRLQVLVDGQVVLRRDIEHDLMSRWSPSARMALGNHWRGARPWLGELARVEIFVGGRVFNCLAPDHIDRPKNYWANWRLPSWGQIFRWEPYGRRDKALNFLCFVPLGLTLAALRWPRSRVVFPILACSLASLSVEFLQIFFDGRVTSASDWILNTLGGAAGALFLCWLDRRTRILETG